MAIKLSGWIKMNRKKNELNWIWHRMQWIRWWGSNFSSLRAACSFIYFQPFSNEKCNVYGEWKCSPLKNQWNFCQFFLIKWFYEYGIFFIFGLLDLLPFENLLKKIHLKSFFCQPRSESLRYISSIKSKHVSQKKSLHSFLFYSIKIAIQRENHADWFYLKVVHSL